MRRAGLPAATRTSPRRCSSYRAPEGGGLSGRRATLPRMRCPRLTLLCVCSLATALPGAALPAAGGVGAGREGAPGRALPTNLTVIFEGEERLFATRGEDHCTVDELRQERLGGLGGSLRSRRLVRRGFCTSPASTLNSDARILVSRFDFAGSAVFVDH